MGHQKMTSMSWSVKMPRNTSCVFKREGDVFRQQFRKGEPAAIDILECMLRFSPRARISVGMALEHRVFENIREISREIVSPTHVTLEFEKEPDLDESLLRKYFRKEIRKYR